MFRINDRTGKHWIDSQVNLFFIWENMLSNEEELIPNYVCELELVPYGMLFWPVEIVHEITLNSPLWNVSAGDLMIRKFEIIATITGSSIVTGQSSTSQTSYLSTREVMWGCFYGSCMEYNSEHEAYEVVKKHFNRTVVFDSPLCSASHLSEIGREFLQL